MGARKLEEQDGLINIEVVSDEEQSVICFRCMACNLFIKRAWNHFYCPHCSISFMEDIDVDTMQETEDLLNYMHDIQELMK